VTTKSDRPTAAAMQLAPLSGAPGQARTFLTEFVRAEGAEQYAEDGRLVVSELVTNGVQHARTEMSVDLVLTRAGLEVGVHDDGPGEPHVVPVAQRGLGGRGLALVSRLAQEWGVEFAERGGKRVWCLLTARSAPRAATPAAGTQIHSRVVLRPRRRSRVIRERAPGRHRCRRPGRPRLDDRKTLRGRPQPRHLYADRGYGTDLRQRQRRPASSSQSAWRWLMRR
jgi:anti-sigma regulatory factor (Ser/Thr protein kinase)